MGWPGRRVIRRRDKDAAVTEQVGIVVVASIAARRVARSGDTPAEAACCRHGRIRP